MSLVGEGVGQMTGALLSAIPPMTLPSVVGSFLRSGVKKVNEVNEIHIVSHRFTAFTAPLRGVGVQKVNE